MAKSKISELNWGIELGENRAKMFGKLVESMKAGSLVKINSALEISKAGAAEVCAGILNKLYDVDLDTAAASGDGGNIVNMGYVGLFCEDPGVDKEIGEPLFDGAGTAGSAAWAAGGKILGRIVERVSNGDTVALIKIDRG